MYNTLEIDECMKRAQTGDVLAQKQLGMILSRSKTTLNEGVNWLKKAAETDADAMYLLGRIYLKKYEDSKNAFSWYKKAALNNHIDAMIDVGAFYLFGFQVEKDVGKAIEWYKKAASMNSPVGYHNLGFLCFQDSNLYSEAFKFFEKSASLGYADSAYMLGVMYHGGLGVVKDAKSVLEYLSLSYKLGKHYSCRPIGDLFFQGYFDNGIQNYDKAFEWYLRGMENNVLSCIEVLGDCYYYGFGTDADFSLAYDFYKMAAEKGSASSAFALGLMYASGEGVKKSFNEALKWMLVAERKGYSEATKYVGMLTDVLKEYGPSGALIQNGGNVGIRLRSSYSESAEEIIAEQRYNDQQNKKKNASIYAAAGAISGSGSFTDYEMGAVINPNGQVTYVDTDMGIIMNSNGAVASHDANSGVTVNWNTGGVMLYDETFDATLDLSSCDLSYHFNGFTIK